MAGARQDTALGHDVQPAAPPRFGSAAARTLATQLAVAVTSFVNLLLVARALGPEGRGEVSLLTVMAMLTSGLAAAGVEEATINLAGTEPEARPSLATNALALAGVLGGGGAVLLGVATAAVPALAGGTSLGLRLVCLASIPILLAKLFLKFLANADFGFGATNVAWLLPPIATLVVNGGLAAIGGITPGRAFAAWVTAHAAAGALLVWWVVRRSAGFGPLDLKLARRTLRFGVRSHPGRVLTAGNYRLDQWIVGSVAGTAELGRYAIAVAWAEVLYYLPTVLVVTQRPYLVRAEPDDAARKAAQVFRLGAISTAALAAGICVAAPVLCTGVFGDAFAGSVTDLRLLVAGAIGVVAMQVLGSALTAQRFPGLASLAAAAAFAATAVLSLLLIAPLGGAGAALTSAAAYLIGGAVTVVLFTRALRTPLARLVPGRRDIERSVAILGRAFESLPHRRTIAP